MTTTTTTIRKPRVKKPKLAPEATTGPKTTHIIFLLDESGSMAPTATDVRGGFNTYIESIKDDGNVYRLTVIKFGTEVRPLWKDLPLDKVPKLTEKDYLPLDSTALYDAIGFALDQTKELLGTKEHPYGEEPVILVIATDGHENASRKFGREAITARIKRRQDAKNWTFVYMGADVDSWEAEALGIATGNILTHASSSAGTNAAYGSLSRSTTASATSGSWQTSRFFKTDDEKKQ